MQAPSAQEQQASAAAYRQTTREIDQRSRKRCASRAARTARKDFEIIVREVRRLALHDFADAVGLAAPQGAKPEVDLIGARQTIDTLALLQEKTKGNLTPAEENMFQNCLYELRMAYLEVTNLITHPPQGGLGGDGKA